jgi:hypothetical protein
MSENETIQSQPVGPEKEEWYKHMQTTIKETPKRLEEAAKALTGVISITLALFLAIAKDSFEKNPETLVQVAVVLWLVSLLAAFVVIFPKPYGVRKGSTEDYVKAHKRIIRFKYGFLVAAVILFLAALGMLCFRFFIFPG